MKTVKTATSIAAGAIALVLSVTTSLAQTVRWSDDFSNPSGWSIAGCQTDYANQQCALFGQFGPTPTGNPTGTYGFASHGIPTSGGLPDGETLEARVDLVSANQPEIWGDLGFMTPGGNDYHLLLDEDEVGLLKGTSGLATFLFWTNTPTKAKDVTLVLSMKRIASDLKIDIRVLDKKNGYQTLFHREYTDTPDSDTALPSGTVKGFLSVPDPAGTPGPILKAPPNVLLGLPWANPLSATDGAARVIYDNLEVWQYATPQLSIQNAVVLSWPATPVGFVLETSADPDSGPWGSVSDPWVRTNATRVEVSVPASGASKYYRLRFGP